jgi:hypothetical protein
LPWLGATRGSNPAVIAVQIVHNLPELLIRPGDAVWRATLRRQRTRKVQMSIPRAMPVGIFRENSTMSSC